MMKSAIGRHSFDALPLKADEETGLGPVAVAEAPVRGGVAKGSERATGRKRLNVEFPHHVADQLDAYAEVTGRSKTEFLRLAIGTYAVLCDELMEGNRIFITGPDAKQHLRELVLPA